MSATSSRGDVSRGAAPVRHLARIANAFDRAVVRVASGRNEGRGKVALLPEEEKLRQLDEITDFYRGQSEDAIFPSAAPIGARVAASSSGGGLAWEELRWTSAFEPLHPAVAAKYLSRKGNEVAHARVYRAAGPSVPRAGRPALVLVHGYTAGQWPVEERAWPIAWLTRTFDVAIAVLPFHAARAPKAQRGAPPFPAADPRITIEGFRQATLDLRGLVAFLRARGAPSVGMMGMSLGGYTTSLLATVEPTLRFAVPFIPLASLGGFARHHGRLGSGAAADRLEARLEATYAVISPLARPAKIGASRILVVGAEADGITPFSHAERLSAHFGAELVAFPGGHLLQFGRAEAFRQVGRFVKGLAD